MDGNQQGVSLEALLGFVKRAVDGDRQLLVRLFRELQRLAANQDAPPKERKLAEVLEKVLMGEREPDLSQLDSEAAGEIEAWLSGLGGKSH